VRAIRPGERVFVGTACATPRRLLRALHALEVPPAGVQLVHFLTDGAAIAGGGGRGTPFRHRAFYIGKEWQGAGLGRLLQTRIMEYARAHGVRGFTADVLADNGAMLAVFRRSGCQMTSRLVDGAFEVQLLFTSTGEDAGAASVGRRERKREPGLCVKDEREEPSCPRSVRKQR
jgi:GNAT superfamily N-acetyltransferase